MGLQNRLKSSLGFGSYAGITRLSKEPQVTEQAQKKKTNAFNVLPDLGITKNVIGSIAAVKGEQLTINNGAWGGAKSQYQFQGNDRKEDASDTWSVGWNNLVSFSTGFLGLLKTTLSEASFIALAQYAVPILVTQALLRVLFNQREYFGAQNKSANKLVKMSINVAIALTYVSALVITFAYSALVTTVIPVMGLAVSSVRAGQGFLYAITNYIEERKIRQYHKKKQHTHPYDIAQLERVVVQKQKRLLQGVSSLLVAVAAGCVCFGGFTFGLPALAIFVLGAATINVGALIYQTAREFPGGREFCRFREYNAPELNPDPNALQSLNSPSKHQTYLRTEDWSEKKTRLTNDTHSAEGVRLFHNDIVHEITAIYHHVSILRNEDGTLPNDQSSNQQRKEMCVNYLERLLDEKIRILTDQKDKIVAAEANEPWHRAAFRTFQESIGLVASKTLLAEKINLAECLKRLIATDNGKNPAVNSTRNNSISSEANQSCTTFDHITNYDALDNLFRSNSHGLRSVYNKFSDMEALYRALCPAPTTETYSNRGYFSFLAEYPVEASSAVAADVGETTESTVEVEAVNEEKNSSLGLTPPPSFPEKHQDTGSPQSISGLESPLPTNIAGLCQVTSKLLEANAEPANDVSEEAHDSDDESRPLLRRAY